MTAPDIIEIAKKAGAVTEMRHITVTSGDGIVFSPDELDRFAALYREALIASGEVVERGKLIEAVNVEREECAKVAECLVIDREDGDDRDPDDSLFFETCQAVAATIRARSQP